MLKLAYFLHVTFTTAFTLVVWVHVDTFGTTAGCNVNNSVKFVLFGKSISATSDGLRIWSIVIFALVAFCLPFTAIGLIAESSPTAEERDADSGKWEGLDWIIGGSMVPVWILNVVTIEQIIQRNGLRHASAQWTYGQAFALVLVLGPICDLVSAIWRRITTGGQNKCPRCSIQRGGI